jgi:hypothetical protein
MGAYWTEEDDLLLLLIQIEHGYRLTWLAKSQTYNQRRALSSSPRTSGALAARWRLIRDDPIWMHMQNMEPTC